MKQAILFSLLTVTLITACDKQENRTTEMKEPGTIVAKREIRIEGSPLRLPAGTRVTKSKDGYALEVELPAGYFFLTSSFQPTLDESAKHWPIIRATYKCKCSGDNACQVFYQEDAGGFGCLHKSCNGSCTGSFTVLQQEITGVLNNKNSQVSAHSSAANNNATLTSKGWEVFFSAPAVQEIITGQYEKMYSKLSRPDFKQLTVDKNMQQDHVFLKVQLYGVSFFMLAPKEMENHKNNFATVPVSSAVCKCDSDKGTCQKKSWSFLNMWATYWCEGSCNGCELTVN